MRNERKKFPIVIYFLFLISYFLFLVILASCGKKGDPTLKSYEKPDPPSNLMAIHRESEIILLWGFPKKRENTIKGFYLVKSIAAAHQEDAAGSSNSGDVKRVFIEPDKRSYVDEDFIIGSKYIYKVVSQNLKDVLSVDSNIVVVEPKDLPPPPGGLLFKIEYDSLTLSWDGIGNGIFYNIYKSDKKGVYPLTPLNTEPLKGTSFKDWFDIKKTVYYSIRSLKEGTVRNEGPASEEIPVNPSEFIPAAPQGIHALADQDGVHLMWKEASETWVIGYKVYRETDKKEGFISIGETSVPAYLDREKPLTKTNYRVTALGPSKEGPSSEVKNVIFVPPK